MNKVLLVGRLCRDPEIRYTQQGDEQMAVARYTLAVDRRYKKDNEQSADFIYCVAFGRSAEFADKYFKQGTKICVCGRIQTGSYTNRDGNKVYTTDVIVEEQEFAESKNTSGNDGSSSRQQAPSPAPDPREASGFMSIPEGIEDDLPFK